MILSSVAKANSDKMIGESIAKAAEKMRNGMAEDPDEWEYGDGDQAPLHANTVEGRTVKHLFGCLADFPHLSERGLLSNWAIACYNQDLKQAKRLIRREPRVLDKRETLLRWSGLHMAFWGYNDASEVDDSFIQHLVDRGAPVDARDSKGCTVLSYCLLFLGPSGFKIADFLLSRGADVNARDRYGKPLLFREEFQDPRCYEWLLRNGADFNALNAEGIAFRQLSGVAIRGQIILHMVRECHRQRKEAKKNGYFRTCFVCKKRRVRKRCSGCYLIWYCSKECQVNCSNIVLG